MTVESTPAAFRFINLKGNQYLYMQYKPQLSDYDKSNTVQSKLLKYNRETSAYEPVCEKNIRFYTDGRKWVAHDYPQRVSFTRSCGHSVALSPTRKYNWIIVHEHDALLTLVRAYSNKLKLNVFNMKENLSEFSPFARKHISKTLKGLADGTVIANENLSKILSTLKGIR